ncbi:MAG: LytTR family DNA-binding domain-containing protein [Bacteroidota bacterium]
MNILIIEDEVPAFKRLSKLVLEVIPDAHMEQQIDSIAAAKEWFANHDMPDLVFMDIHLADGSGLDLLKMEKIECPVVFVTAYDEYAIQAFKANSIDYLLKPIKKEDLEGAIDKLKQFEKIFSQQETFVPYTKPGNPSEYKKRFVIRFGEHIKTLLVEEIAYCFSENKATYARTFEGRTYPMDHNLDALDQMLNPQDFFRINRQYLISLKTIEDMRSYTKARVIVTLNPPVKEPPVVSSERAADFKLWLSGEI